MENTSQQENKTKKNQKDVDRSYGKLWQLMII